MNIQHIYRTQILYCSCKGCIVSIIAICCYKIEYYSLFFLMTNYLCRKFQFASKCHSLLRNACLLTALNIIAPILWKEYSGINHRGKISITQAGKNRHLAIRYLPHIAAVLMTYSNTFVPFLYPAAFVYYQSGHLSFRQNRTDTSRYLVDQLTCIPVRFRNKMSVSYTHLTLPTILRV